MELKLKPILDKPANEPIVIAGPCSAETEEQVMTTARELAASGKVDLFRAGIWKPRTRPNTFEGVGTEGLKWLRRVKEETGMLTTTEVANKAHVFDALKYGVDVLWIGARTTVNPFSVQEIADALEGVDIPVIIKNPINPDLSLWKGAIERIYKAGIDRLAVIHRGFAYHGKTSYRNVPRWQIPIALKQEFPDLPIIVDNSHICGRRDTLQAVAQKGFDLSFEGIMTEVHPDPDNAWSDAAQQITPSVYLDMISELQLRQDDVADPIFNQKIEHLRGDIDEIDDDILNLLGRRMDVANKIGQYKKDNNISILQSSRWSEILEAAVAKGKIKGLSEEFVNVIMMAIHQESINHQAKVMNSNDVKA